MLVPASPVPVLLLVPVWVVLELAVTTEREPPPLLPTESVTAIVTVSATLSDAS